MTIVSQDFVACRQAVLLPSRMISTGMDGQIIYGKVLRPTELSMDGHPVFPIEMPAVRLGTFREHNEASLETVDCLLGFDLLAPMSPLLDTGNDRLYFRPNSPSGKIP